MVDEDRKSHTSGSGSWDVGIGIDTSTGTHSRNKDIEHEQSAEAPMCRFCHDYGDEGGEGELISPCACRGSVKYVHRECLDQWRTTSSNHDSFWKCDSCKTRYQFQMFHNPEREKLIWLRISRDLFLATSFIVSVILLLSWIVSLFDTNGSIPGVFYLDNHPKLGYVACIVVGVFAIVGLVCFLLLLASGDGGGLSFSGSDEGYALLVLLVVVGGIATLVGLIYFTRRIVLAHTSKVRRKLSVKDYVVLSVD